MAPDLAPMERHDLGSHGRELILDANHLAVSFKVEGGTVEAVRDVSFQLHKGETIALEGDDILKLSEPAMRQLRGNKISMIFQEPMSSLNPVYTVGQQICEILHL